MINKSKRASSLGNIFLVSSATTIRISNKTHFYSGNLKNHTLCSKKFIFPNIETYQLEFTISNHKLAAIKYIDKLTNKKESVYEEMLLSSLGFVEDSI